MAGMNRNTGDSLGGFDHLRQSIQDILTTPIGTRVHRREYGSRIPRAVDRPINQAFIADVVAGTAEALDRWEPRLRLERVIIDSISADGQIALSLVGYYLLNGERIELQGLVI